MVPSLHRGLFFCSFVVVLFSVVCASVVHKIEGCEEGEGHVEGRRKKQGEREKPKPSFIKKYISQLEQ